MSRLCLATLLAVCLSCSVGRGADEKPGEWVDLLETVDTQKNAVAGRWQKSGVGVSTDATRGSRLVLPYQPAGEYDFRVQFTRTSGVHSVMLLFVAGTRQATFEVDAWGQHLAGLQMINGRSLRENSTRATGYTLQNGKKYTAIVQVRKDHVRAYLDDKLVAEHKTDGTDLSVPNVWRISDSKSLAIGAYEAATVFHTVQVRAASGNTPLVAAKPTPRPLPEPTSRPVTPRSKGGTKRVLIVIANQDFFYREYGDPRQELERAGIQVEVAAARKETCRPHANSGQQGNGYVMPDLAVADADASRYDAIMFSGGWGSSQYQYAFRGSYSTGSYNGDRQSKAAVNKLLGEFIKQDKYVGALCHGVSVLAWARVNGKSILDGKKAVGSPRKSPAGIYNGQRAQPLSRWNAEVNGAKLTPARSIGNPRTSADDVAVDGKIVTGEDDNSARLFGATLAKLLTASK